MANFVFFGITGDLARNKIVPALFNLYVRGEVNQNNFICLGIGRKKYLKEEFQTLISEYLSGVSIKNFADRLDIKESEIIKCRQNFILSCMYISGDFADISLYNKIKKDIDVATVSRPENKTLCQLAVPPDLHDVIIDKLIESKILNIKSMRLMLEKPFGHDVLSAKKLYKKITSKLNPKQLVLIDHYLGKEAVIELENIRMSGYMEDVLNSKSVKRIEVRSLENKTVEGRGVFYDKVGALRDIGQNHLLQVLAIAAGEYKNSRELDSAKTNFISKLSLDSKKNQVFGQYRGYLKEMGVSPDSSTETFFSVGFKSNLKRWHGTEMRITGGKALKDKKSEIIYKFRNGTESRLSINDINRAAYDYVFLGVLHENFMTQASFTQIVASWKLLESLESYKDKKHIKPTLYEKGTNGVLKNT